MIYKLPANRFTHNDFELGDKVRLTGCNKMWTVISIIDGYRGIRVQPENPDEDTLWVDVNEVTGRAS